MKSIFRNSFAENVSNLSWTGGFFDGEGCIYYHPDRVKATVKGVEYRSPEIQVIVGQSGPDGKKLMEAFQEVFGFGKITTGHGSSLTKKVPYMCRLSGKKAISFLQIIEPHLVLKREKAQMVIAVGLEHFYGE